jgi:ApaG protein
MYMPTITKLTEGISVSVDTLYRESQSNPEANYYLFSYFITIENRTGHSVQLMRRRWEIFDSSGDYHQVEGAGVVGEQPVLKPGGRYTYESSCNFTTEIGKMKGVYIFEQLRSHTTFEVEIPEFTLIVPSKLN